MSQVARLLDQITTLTIQRSPLVKNVVLQPFREALLELDSLIGMDEIKEQTVRQLQHLILRSSQRQPMLHCVMYGPPGVGKTRLGKCLAKLWTSSGIIKAAPVLSGFGSDVTQSKKSNLIVENQKLKETIASIHRGNKQAISQLQHTRRRYVGKRLRSYSRHTKRYIDYDEWCDLHRALKSTEESLEQLTKETVTEPHSTDYNITIASRADFVAEYVGQTVPKTLNFLNANQGKVVFIDEAYLLVTDERDTFGLEAITTINQYMDQHPGKIIIIFGGYKKELQRTIFHYQKGLERRCRWVFEIEDYTAEQLAKIFTQQLKMDSWYLDPKINIVQWFTERKSSFPAFGGDMETLSFHVGLSQTDEIWHIVVNNQPNLTAQMVSLSALNSGYERFLRNRALDRKEESIPPLSMYI